jgi:hypothetical protein
VAKDDFGEGITWSTLQGGKQLVSVIVYRNGLSHARKLHENEGEVNRDTAEGPGMPTVLANGRATQ